ncbi:hypothetical protein SLE2022_181730 [Rubroshorea leprosula]
MAVMEKLKMFVVQEPVVAASCFIAGVVLKLGILLLLFQYSNEALPNVSLRASLMRLGRNHLDASLFLPAVVRPILDSLESSKQVRQPALSDVVAGVTGKKA